MVSLTVMEPYSTSIIAPVQWTISISICPRDIGLALKDNLKTAVKLDSGQYFSKRGRNFQDV
jgi:hypothetical protein